MSLHTAAESAVRTAVKSALLYRNDAIIAFLLSSLRSQKNKDNAKVTLASSNN